MIQKQKKFNLLIGFTGSVASIKASEIINALYQSFNGNINLKIVYTNRAKQFIDFDKFNNVEMISDDDEWNTWKQRNDPVLHIELRKWADGILIAPLSANTLAKIVNGLCDNLLTNIIRAWDYKKPIIVAPAMNTLMYDNPITFKQLKKLEKMKVHIINPIEKVLMCGDIGKGAMEEPQRIGQIVFNLFYP